MSQCFHINPPSLRVPPSRIREGNVQGGCLETWAQETPQGWSFRPVNPDQRHAAPGIFDLHQQAELSTRGSARWDGGVMGDQEICTGRSQGGNFAADREFSAEGGKVKKSQTAALIGPFCQTLCFANCLCFFFFMGPILRFDYWVLRCVGF